MGKTLLKIVMPSAPSVAISPYDAQTIGLTDWDSDITVDGLTYRAVRFALGDATSSQDFSQGKGGFALGNQIASLTLENAFDGGLLDQFVDSGEIPLKGAVVYILDETGFVTPQTWTLQEKTVDGASISFALRSPGYMSTKLIQFGTEGVGAVVGDSRVNSISSSKRYKGVMVPGKSTDKVLPTVFAQPLGRNGNPHSWDTAYLPYSGAASKTSNSYTSYGWPSGGSVFTFHGAGDVVEFIDSFLDCESVLKPNTSILISDGTNSEVLLTTDANGAATYAFFDNQNITYGQAYDGISKGTKLANTSSDDFSPLFAWQKTTTGALTLGTIVVRTSPTGSLKDSAPGNVSLYVISGGQELCYGAASIVGSTVGLVGDNNEIAVFEHRLMVSSGVLKVSPLSPTVAGFFGWVLLNGVTHYWIGGSAIDPTNDATWIGAVENIPDFDSGAAAISMMGSKLQPQFYFDVGFSFSPSLGNKTNSNKIFASPIYLVESYSSGHDISFKFYPADSLKVLPSGSYSKLFSGIVPNRLRPQNQFDIGSVGDYKFTPEIYGNLVDASAWGRLSIRGIEYYGLFDLSFESNPVIVIPGNFPLSGISSPTWTPRDAAGAIANWLQFRSDGQEPLLTGGITPTAGTWGEYIGGTPGETDTTYGKQRLSNLMEEAWIYGAEVSVLPASPDVEVAEYPVISDGSVDDIVTEPSWQYSYAGTSPQFTAAIKNVGESFDISKGDGYFWSGWQEKDAAHFLTSPGAAPLAMAQLDDCLAVVRADGYLACSYDGGQTWTYVPSMTGGSTVAFAFGSAAAGNGQMLFAGNVVGEDTYLWYSLDSGRSIFQMDGEGMVVRDSRYDASSTTFWQCGSGWSTQMNGRGYATVWHAQDVSVTSGVPWATLSIPMTSKGCAYEVAPHAGTCVASVLDDAGIWMIWAYDGTTWTQPPSLPQSGSVQPHVAYWGGKFRVAVGSTLWSSEDLVAWSSVVLPFACTSFSVGADDVVTAVGIGGTRIGYSRDSGATWRLLSCPIATSTTAQSGLIWDADALRYCLWNEGTAVILALGDPSVLDIWHRCRASYLANSGTIATATYKMPGLYDSSELVRWLLDCKDATDSEYEQERINWITRGARFVTVRGRYSSIAAQLTVMAGQPMTIPRRILTYSGHGANLPATGIVCKAEHKLSGADKGLSEIELILPPL